MDSMHSLSETASIDYLARLHVPAPRGLHALEPTLPTLQALHEAHLLAVPFENLSIHYRWPIILQEEALFNKIVRQHRGGFCYELNGLFAWLLHQAGFQVTLLSAEVSNDAGGFGPDFDHLTLLVHSLSDADWLADVGFGDSFRQPLSVVAALEQEEADGRKYRLLKEYDAHEDQAPRDFWILQQYSGDSWKSQYRFTLQPRTLTDFTEMCHYQQTSPESHFTQKRICSLALPEGRVSLSDLRLITTMEGKREERILGSEEEYREVLAQQFGIMLL